ncbi:MAG: hypothetical protein V1734_02505 [Nanoarchaeota archaeon]
MAIKTPTIEELVDINRNIKRRLDFSDDCKTLLDARGREITTTPIYRPWAICVDSQSPTGAFISNENRPFSINSINPTGDTWYLTLSELHLSLGLDYPYESTCINLNAVCKASTDGSSLANAYVLGPDMFSIHREYRYVVIPVQYYKIDEKIHKELGIESDQKKMEWWIKEIERKRQG